MSPKRKRGRPGLKGTIVVSVRLPGAVYEAYIRRAARVHTEVRTQLRLTLTANADRGGLTAKDARAQAVALLLLADEIELKTPNPPPDLRSLKIAQLPA